MAKVFLAIVVAAVVGMAAWYARRKIREAIERWGQLVKPQRPTHVIC